MISPGDIPANQPPEPDKHDPGYRILQCSQMASVEMFNLAISRLAIINQLVREVLAEVPDADFIEVRAVKLEWRPTDERNAPAVPTGE